MIQYLTVYKRWSHLGPDVYCKSNDNKRSSESDSAAVSQESNKNMGSWVQTANVSTLLTKAPQQLKTQIQQTPQASIVNYVGLLNTQNKPKPQNFFQPFYIWD